MNSKMILIAIALVMVGVVSAYPKIVVSGFSIKDGSASVGKDFTLSLNLTDLVQECAIYVGTSIQANPPFIMRGVNTVRFDELCYGEVKTVDIPMRIDPTATGGTYQLVVTNSYQTATFTDYSNTDTLSIFVAGTPDIHASVVSSDPIDVYPGDTATVSVNLENDGSFAAQALNANMTVDSPLEVKWSKSFFSMGQLDAKQSGTASFVIEVPKDAEAKDYMMHLSVQYYDENQNLETRNYDLVFHVKSKAMFETQTSTVLYPNMNGNTVHLILKNTGTDTARKINAKIQPLYPFSTDGSVRYIESLDPGQTAAVDFVVDVDKDATIGNYGLKMIVDYEDAQGKALQDTATLSLDVKPKGFFRMVFLDYWFLWIVAIVVAAIVFRKRKKKK